MGTTWANGDIITVAKLNRQISTQNSNYTITALDDTVLVACSGAGKTITLPAASNIAGRIYTIKKIDSSASTVTIDANGSETIDGALTQTISSQYGLVTIQSTNSNWVILNRIT